MRYDKRNEVYYWIKLRQGMMQSTEIKLLMRQPDGGWYFSIYIYLIMMSMNSSGRLIQKVGEIEMVYDLTTLTQELMFFKIDTIRVAIAMLKDLKLIYSDEDNVLCITNFNSLVGQETGWAEQKRKQKEREELECVEKVHADFHAPVHATFPPEIRDKSIEYRYKNKEIESINHNDKYDKYDKYDKVTFASDFEIQNKIKDLMINEWHIHFSDAHIFTKYLVHSKYIADGDIDLLLAFNSFFDNYLKRTYSFEEMKSHVQYFLLQYRKLKEIDRNKIVNKMGYFTGAVKKNQRSIEWMLSDEFKEISKLHITVENKLKKEAKEKFPDDEIRQEIYLDTFYLKSLGDERMRIRKEFDRKCSVKT